MKETNWSKWASIAEIVSSFAIVITLIYLTIQTKQNTDAIRANASDTLINTDLQLIQDITTNPEISLNMTKDELTEAEMQQLVNWIVGLIRTREHQWFQYKNGVLDEENWRSYLSALQINLASSRTRYIWNLLNDSGAFDKEFSAEINEYLSNYPTNDTDMFSESDYQKYSN